MRASNRTRILEAAIRVINREGVRAVTFESVSAESGLTRGGLLYHFPSREALLQGIDEYLVQNWEASMERLLGKSGEHATTLERYQAFVQVSAQSATRAELMFMLESADSGSKPWMAAVDRWAPTPPAPDGTDPAALDNFIARLAADGLWIFEAMYRDTMDDTLRAQVVERISGLLKKPDSTPQVSKKSS